MTVLAGLRVLDLADPEMGLTGQTLADLGADVVLVPQSARSDWVTRAYARNKRTLRDTPGTNALLTLLRNTDVLIESPRPDGAWRFDAAELAQRFPGLIHVSVSWFGRTGPKSGYAATDLIATAASGYLFLTGVPGAAPLRISAPQAGIHAAADAAVAVLIALRARDVDGRGQHIDASAQDSLTLATLGRSIDAAVGQPRAERSSGKAIIGALEVRYIYPTRDGFALVQPGILPPLAAFGKRLCAWLIEEGLLDESFAQWDWGTTAFRMMAGQVEAASWARFEQATATLIAARTKQALMDESVRRKVLIAPLFTVGDLLSSAQFAARRFVGGEGVDRYPGPFAQFSKSPLQPSRLTASVSAQQLENAWPARALNLRSPVARRWRA
ncbi:MAG: hypothetical protein HC809_09580 [Gammaproteobacteria bacterium]|nr:hypothetical protein [Gammaproteobacteria bacterium]